MDKHSKQHHQLRGWPVDVRELRGSGVSGSGSHYILPSYLDTYRVQVCGCVDIFPVLLFTMEYDMITMVSRVSVIQ